MLKSVWPSALLDLLARNRHRGKQRGLLVWRSIEPGRDAAPGYQ
jgi:hypothetical protein